MSKLLNAAGSGSGAVLLLAAGSLGFFMLLTQTLLARELVVSVYGDEISLAMTFGVWLASIFCGSLGGAALARRFRDRALFVLVLSALLPLALLALTTARSTWLFHPAAAAAFSYWRSLFMSLLAVFPFGFAAGTAFPLAVSAAAPAPAASPSGPAVSLYAAEAVGSVAAGLVCTYFWSAHGDPFRLLALAALPLGGLGWLNARLLPGGWSRTGPLMTLGLATLVLLPGVSGRMNDSTNLSRWRTFSGLRLVESRLSHYQYLQLGELDGQYALYGSGQLAATIPDPETASVLATLLLAQHPSPRRVLIVGDASSGLARQLLRRRLEEVVSVEADPLFREMIESRLPEMERRALGDRRFHPLIADGRRFIRHCGRRVQSGREGGFDIILLNLPEPSTVLLNRFYTREFFADARTALSPSGILAIQPTSLGNYSSGAVGRYDACLFHTLGSVFPDLLACPGPPCLFFAAKQPGILETDPDRLEARFSRLSIPAAENMRLFFRSMMQPQAIRFLNQALKKSPSSDLNRDERPIAYFLFSSIAGREDAGKLSGALEGFRALSRPLPGVAAVFFLLGLLFSRRRSGRTASGRLLFLAGTVGMAGMALQLLLVFLIQAVFGQIYWTVGLFSALFMGGLTLGALGGRHRVQAGRRKVPVSSLLLLLPLLYALLAALQPLLRLVLALPGPLAWGIFAFFSLLNGAFTGAVYPLALSRLPDPAGRGAGWLYACDHLGGAVGAFLVPSVLLPLYGMKATGLGLAALLTAAGILAWMAPDSKKAD